MGAHTLRFGGQFHYDQVNMHPNATFNGTFTISGTETGSDFADFYWAFRAITFKRQAAAFISGTNMRVSSGRTVGACANNLTLNYGLRWDFIEPFYEKYNQIQTIVQGQQSTVYPARPMVSYFRVTGESRALLSPAQLQQFCPENRTGLFTEF